MDIYKEYLDLARLALSGRRDDVVSLLDRARRRAKADVPELNAHLKELLAGADRQRSIHRRTSLPESLDGAASRPGTTRLEKSQPEFVTAVWPDEVGEALSRVVLEQDRIQELENAGLHPTRTLLFVGPPGVGKTLAASWLAAKLRRTLLTVDLATLMSSRLGKTGSNLSRVLREGADSSSILLLDEFDSVGKKRDDVGDVGELKRLVNVLLQSLDRWPPDAVLIAATNHPEILDRAVWRRFDAVVQFPLPGKVETSKFVETLLAEVDITLPTKTLKLVTAALADQSFAEMEIFIKAGLRRSIIDGTNPAKSLADAAAKRLQNRGTKERTEAARALIAMGFSQRHVASLLSMSRDTIRKYLHEKR